MLVPDLDDRECCNTHRLPTWHIAYLWNKYSYYDASGVVLPHASQLFRATRQVYNMHPAHLSHVSAVSGILNATEDCASPDG